MGLYNNRGQRKVKIINPLTDSGIYSSEGEYNGVLEDENAAGLYHPCGAFNVTAIDPDNPPSSSYAPNGSLYVIETDDGYIVYKDPADYTPPEEEEEE